jgi:hypothetical protein
MDTTKMGMVKLKNSAKTHNTSESIIDVIVQNVCKIPNYDKLKNDPELFRYILELLENGLTDTTIDKKALIDKIVTRIFPDMKPDEKLVVDGVIAFVINNELIQKIGCYDLLKKWVKSKVKGSDPVKKA